MSLEEEFDSIIRQKAEDEYYAFDENNWRKADRLLDAERKTAQGVKLKKMYVAGTIVLLVGLAALLSLRYVNQTTAVSQVPEVVNSNSASDNKLAIVPGKQLNENEVAPNSEFSHRATLASGSSPSTIQQIKTSSDKNNSGTVTAAGNPKQTETKAGLFNDAISETANTSEQADIKNNAETKGSSGNEPVAENASVPVQDNPISSLDYPVADDMDGESLSAEVENVTMNQLSVPFLIPFNSNEEQELKHVPFNHLKRYEDDYVLTNTQKKQYLNVELGVNYLFGWNTKQGKDGYGLNWLLGFNYGRYFSGKNSISAGVQVYNLGNISQPFYQISSKDYGFGSTTTYTRVKTTQLYYVAVPLKYNYTLNSSNTIGVGINAGYLLTGNNTVSEYYLLDNEEKYITSPLEVKGIYEGVNRFNMMLSAHYNTQFFKRLSLGLEFNYGLNEIFENMGEIKTIEKPIGVRVSMHYTLFNK